MTFALSILAVVLFAVSIEQLGLVRLCRRVVTESRTSLEVMCQTGLDDEAKEMAVKTAAVRMFGLSGRILALAALALLPSIAVLSLGIWIEITDVARIEQTSLSLPFIIVNIVVFAVFLLRKSTP